VGYFDANKAPLYCNFNDAADPFKLNEAIHQQALPAYCALFFEQLRQYASQLGVSGGGLGRRILNANTSEEVDAVCNETIKL
jgi:hypothetical protein